MSLTIVDEVRTDALVVRLAGRLDTQTSKTFEDHLAGALGRGRQHIVVHLGEVDYISSYGLRVLLLNAKKLRGEAGSFALCDVTAPVRSILEISGFDRILTIRATLDEALDAGRP